MEWYLKVMSNYAVFDGRARRQEYWMFVLINSLISIGLLIVDRIVFGSDGVGLLRGLYSLGVFIPTIAVTTRRLHDIGKSGWMQLVALIPLIGVIWLLVLECTEGDNGANQYGQDPKQLAYEY